MFYFLIIKVKALIGYSIVVASGAARDVAISRKGRLTRVHEQNTRLRWLTAEKSPAVETKTIVHGYPDIRPQGIPAAVLKLLVRT